MWLWLQTFSASSSLAGRSAKSVDKVKADKIEIHTQQANRVKAPVRKTSKQREKQKRKYIYDFCIYCTPFRKKKYHHTQLPKKGLECKFIYKGC
jgi:hypothetical protein